MASSFSAPFSWLTFFASLNPSWELSLADCPSEQHRAMENESIEDDDDDFAMDDEDDEEVADFDDDEEEDLFLDDEDDDLDPDDSDDDADVAVDEGDYE